MDGHYCWNCKWYFEDRSVGLAGCEEQNMTEEGYDKFCVDAGGDNCPYFEAVHSDEELEAIAKYEEESIDFWCAYEEDKE